MILNQLPSVLTWIISAVVIIEVLLLTEPIDSFMLIRLTQYNDHPLVNIASADFKIPIA